VVLLAPDTLAAVAEHADTGGDEDAERGQGDASFGREAFDRGRFEEQALQHAEHLYRIALRLTGSAQAAEDLVQDAYLRAFRSWRSFTPGTNLAAWLATIMRNSYLDAMRREGRRPRQEPIEDVSEYVLYNRLAEGAAEPQDEVLDRLAGGAIVNALSSLPPQFREVVVLVDIGDFSYQEAADILDVPIGTVMSRLYRGRRLLKRALAEEADEEGAA
jgi:RNA polymerase sigma-70 factor, ECF subfamily